LHCSKFILQRNMMPPQGSLAQYLGAAPDCTRASLEIAARRMQV
jgi:hypothetical protein